MSKVILAIDPGHLLQCGLRYSSLSDEKTSNPKAPITKRLRHNRLDLPHMRPGVSVIHQAPKTWAKKEKHILFTRVLFQKHEGGAEPELQGRPSLRCLYESESLTRSDILLQSLPQGVDRPKTKGRSASVEAESEYEEGRVVIPQQGSEERKKVAFFNGFHCGGFKGAPRLKIHRRNDMGKLRELLAHRSHKASGRVQLSGSRRSGFQRLLEPIQSSAAQG